MGCMAVFGDRPARCHLPIVVQVIFTSGITSIVYCPPGHSSCTLAIPFASQRSPFISPATSGHVRSWLDFFVGWMVSDRRDALHQVRQGLGEISGQPTLAPAAALHAFEYIGKHRPID